MHHIPLNKFYSAGAIYQGGIIIFNEIIEVVMPKAWKSGDYYSLIFTNFRLYILKQTDLKVGGGPGMLAIVGTALLISRMVEYQVRSQEQEEMLNQISLEEVQKIANNSYNYSEMINPCIKKGLGEGTIIFRYPTGGRFFKTSWNEIGIPSEEIESIAYYLARYGFRR